MQRSCFGSVLLVVRTGLPAVRMAETRLHDVRLPESEHATSKDASCDHTTASPFRMFQREYQEALSAQLRQAGQA